MKRITTGLVSTDSGVGGSDGSVLTDAASSGHRLRRDAQVVDTDWLGYGCETTTVSKGNQRGDVASGTETNSRQPTKTVVAWLTDGIVDTVHVTGDRPAAPDHGGNRRSTNRAGNPLQPTGSSND